MNRQEEHVGMILRAMRLAFAEGWAARGRAIGDPSQPQHWSAAYSRAAANLMRRKGMRLRNTSVPAADVARLD